MPRKLKDRKNYEREILMSTFSRETNNEQKRRRSMESMISDMTRGRKRSMGSLASARAPPNNTTDE